MSISELKLIRLEQNTEIKSFNSTDVDLNDFLFSDAKNYYSQLMAVTYLLEDKDKTVAYYSLLNDKITFEENQKGVRNRINRNIPYSKHMNYYPAMKIGRLAVSEEYSGRNIGSEILTFLKYLFTNNNRTGCRFIIVDAYNNERAIKFYQRNRFDFLTMEDEDKDTRLMYYDLMKN